MEYNVDRPHDEEELINNLSTISYTIKKEDSPETQQLKQLLIKAMVLNRGNITKSCKSAKVDRSTYYKYAKEDKEFRIACSDISETVLDEVEDKLFESIKKGDNSSIYFYLKCKGKKRGYIEGNINFNADITDEDKQFLKIGDSLIEF